jgi:surfeit locus 1 family protein
MKFKPTFIPTLFTIPAVIVLLSLGTWQLVRLEWKNNLIGAMNERVAMPVFEMPPIVDNFDDIQYRRVHVTGEFLYDKEVYLFVGAKEFKGAMGYDILTPLRMKNGGVVLVDRGWVPYEKKAAEKRPETLVSGVVEIEGMIHKGEVQKGFTPDNEVDKNLWFWIDIPAIETYTGLSLQNLYVRELKKGDSNVLPIGGDAVIRHRNDHLQYAITWYGLAIILVVIYVIYHTKRRN